MKSKEEFISDIYEKQKKYEFLRLRAIRRALTLCAPLVVGVALIFTVWFVPTAIDSESKRATGTSGGDNIKESYSEEMGVPMASIEISESIEKSPDAASKADAGVARIRNRNSEVLSCISVFNSSNTDSEKASAVGELSSKMMSCMALAETELANADLTNTDSLYIQSVLERLENIEREHEAIARAICDYIGVD